MKRRPKPRKWMTIDKPCTRSYGRPHANGCTIAHPWYRTPYAW